jgi:hypothetical protein
MSRMKPILPTYVLVANRANATVFKTQGRHIAWTLEAGAAWVELNVYEFNQDARHFYEALGYLPLSTKLRRTPLGAPATAG